MKAVKPFDQPDTAFIELGKNQPEYQTLPAIVDSENVVTTEWEFTTEELMELIDEGRLRLRVMTFGRGFAPVKLNVVTRKGEVIE